MSNNNIKIPEKNYIDNFINNQYFNVVINGPKYEDDVSFTNANFSVTRNQSIIDNPKEYYLSISRMTIPLNLCPLFIIPILPNQPNPNLTPFKIGITFNGVLYQRDVQWISQDFLSQPPVQNQIKMIKTPYYYCFDWDHLCFVISKTMNLVFNDFKAANPTSPQAIANIAPKIIFDETSYYFKFIFHESWISNEFVKPFSAGVIKFGGNLNFVNFITGFYYYQYEDNNSAGDSLFMWRDIGNNVYNSTDNTLFQSQNLITLSLINNIRRILVLSPSLPVSPEFLPSNTLTGLDSAQGSLPVVADFIIQNENSNGSRGIAYVTPFFYRYIDLQSTYPLYNFDCQVYFEDTSNDLFPLELSAGQQMSLKFTFVHKSMVKNT